MALKHPLEERHTIIPGELVPANAASNGSREEEKKPFLFGVMEMKQAFAIFVRNKVKDKSIL